MRPTTTVQTSAPAAREPTGAPSLPFTLWLSLGIFTTVLALKWVQPWLESQVRGTHVRCDAPTSEAEVRIVYLYRRGAHTASECGPVVGSRTRKGAR